ncbi:hypothetical protein [Nostoc sp.]|uniref:hypothetical protein n=1 Tax=Nostoc sp. TaxID=1180 RepID=UPI002FF687DF
MSAFQSKATVIKDGYARIFDVLVYLFDQVPKRTSESQHPFVNKVLGLGENFPLCYYAGGSKFFSGETATIETSPIPPSLTPGQRRQSLKTITSAKRDIWRQAVSRLSTSPQVMEYKKRW